MFTAEDFIDAGERLVSPYRLLARPGTVLMDAMRWVAYWLVEMPEAVEGNGSGWHVFVQSPSSEYPPDVMVDSHGHAAAGSKWDYVNWLDYRTLRTVIGTYLLVQGDGTYILNPKDVVHTKQTSSFRAAMAIVSSMFYYVADNPSQTGMMDAIDGAIKDAATKGWVEEQNASLAQIGRKHREAKEAAIRFTLGRAVVP